MHLERPHLNLNRSSVRKKKPTVKMKRAQDEHNKWLAKLGLSHATVSINEIPNYQENCSTLPLSNKVSNGLKQGILEQVLRGRESPEVAKEIENKRKRCAPHWNKGGYQYITDESDLKTLGKKI